MMRTRKKVPQHSIFPRPASGTEIRSHLREWSQNPVIILSVRGEESTKIAALDAGADDHLTKPLGADDLRAGILPALLRVYKEESGLR
jgi:two-component system KDP operon response regulator KdpE